MAVLSDEERRRTWGHIMRTWASSLGGAAIPVNNQSFYSPLAA
jgi:hypothetical protein